MYESLLDAIGNTPITRVTISPNSKNLPFYAKLEYLNPGGSVKDRSAKHMIEFAEQNGLLKPGGILIDASSGNQGIATAMIGKIKGYEVIITASQKVSAEKLATIQSYGAQVIVCPSTSFITDYENYHATALRLHRAIPNSFMPNQYFNIQNSRAHYLSLGPEIWKQTRGKITHFFAGAGTGGTISGAGAYLKEQNPAIKIIAIDAENSWHATRGNPKPYAVEGIGIDFLSPVMDHSIIDEIITVSDQESFTMLNHCAQQGFLVGMSSGSVAAGALKYSQNLNSTHCAVMIFGDSGRAYLSKQSYLQKPIITAIEFENNI